MQGPFQVFGKFGEFFSSLPCNVGHLLFNLRLRVVLSKLPPFLSPFADLSNIFLHSSPVFSPFFSSDIKINALPAALVPFSHVNLQRKTTARLSFA